MSAQIFKPLPLMSDRQLQQYSPYVLDERYLDAAELYSLARTEHISSLYPDSCTKLVTFFYKDIVGEAIFEKTARHAHDKNGSRIYYIEICDVEEKDTGVVKRYNPNTNKFEKVVNYELVENTAVIMEIDQGGFGHFCGAHYKDGVFYVFDSMMYSTGSAVEADYFEYWEKYLKKVFGSGKFTIEMDFYFQKGGKLKSYSCEITGGSLEVENYYSSSVKNQTMEFFADSVFLGVDNQNQYCWMWTIFYLLTKTMEPGYDWLVFHKMIIEKNIIPVVFIKLFASLAIMSNGPAKLRSSRFFKKYFNTVMTNSLTYRETFDPSNTDFSLMKCTIGERVLNGTANTNDKDLSDCVRTLHQILSKDMHGLVAETVVEVGLTKMKRYAKTKASWIYDYLGNDNKLVGGYATAFKKLVAHMNENPVEAKASDLF